MEKQIYEKIINYLSLIKEKKARASDIKKYVFPYGKITNPPNAKEILQEKVLDLMRQNKVEIIDSNSFCYATSEEIEKIKKDKQITIFLGAGIDKISAQDFFSTVYDFYIRLK